MHLQSAIFYLHMFIYILFYWSCFQTLPLFRSLATFGSYAALYHSSWWVGWSCFNLLHAADWSIQVMNSGKVRKPRIVTLIIFMIMWYYCEKSCPVGNPQFYVKLSREWSIWVTYIYGSKWTFILCFIFLRINTLLIAVITIGHNICDRYYDWCL